jgi:hypothetical protein
VAAGRGTGPQGQSNWQGIAAVIGVILLIGYCAGRRPASTSSDYQSSTTPMGATTSGNMAAPAQVQYEELRPGSVQRGQAHLRLASQNEGLTGARIYSENCYAALTRSFSWARLDQCGAADLAAARLAASAPPAASAADIAHFEPETAAGRYLRAATGAGATAEVADQRLSALQGLLVRQTAGPPAEAAPEGDEDLSEEVLPLEEDPEVTVPHPAQPLAPPKPSAPANEFEPPQERTALLR